jgi:hypothetical protein
LELYGKSSEANSTRSASTAPPLIEFPLKREEIARRCKEFHKQNKPAYTHALVRCQLKPPGGAAPGAPAPPKAAGLG